MIVLNKPVRFLSAFCMTVIMLGGGAGIANDTVFFPDSAIEVSAAAADKAYISKTVPKLTPTVAAKSTRDSITLSVSGVEAYGKVVYHILDNNGKEIASAVGVKNKDNDLTSAVYTVKKLKPETSYTYKVYAEVSGDGKQKTRTRSVTVKTAESYAQSCDLKNLKVSKVTDTSVTLSWSKPSKTMTNFNYYVNAKGSAAGKVSGTKYSVTITGLKPNTKYTYGVRGWNTNNYTKTSLEKITFTTDYSVSQKRKIVVDYVKNSFGYVYKHKLNGYVAAPDAPAEEHIRIMCKGLDANIKADGLVGPTDCCGLTLLAYDKIGIHFSWTCESQFEGVTVVGRDKNGKAYIGEDEYSIPMKKLKNGTDYVWKASTRTLSSYSGLKPGDLIFLSSNNLSNSRRACAHVVMYIGGGKIIHCTSDNKGSDLNGKTVYDGVMMNSLKSYLKNSDWIEDIVGVRRYIF
ncbi:MAG: fibronectin type III domain-containing protein [Ruminococcus sp.]|nr:fibronectin type III domain-containing protein [Ruminococcus sp.]